MTEHKHTPGYYRASTMTMSRKAWASLNQGPLNIVQRGQDVLAVVWCDDDSSEQAQARLFAAAPDLLAERNRLATELQHCLCAHEAANSALADARAELDRLRALNAELLAACEHVLNGPLSLPRFAADEMRAAIAKAKGGAA